MELVPGVLVAALGGYTFGFFLFAVAGAKQTRTREHARSALLCLALLARAALMLVGRESFADAMLAVVAGVIFHDAVAARGRTWVYGGYLGAVVVLASGWFGANVLRAVAHAACALSVLGLVTVHARAYLSGNRNGVGVIVGGGALLVTLVADVAQADARMPALTALSFLALLAGLGTKLAAEHSSLSRELAVRRKELRTRTRELQKSYDELGAAQAELVRKEQLAAVGELAAVIAHEVRNPLAVINNAVASLRKGAALGDKERSELYAILDDESSRLNRIVADLLRYARPVTVQRSRVALNELCERALALAKNLEGVKVDFAVLASDVRVWADPNLLRQVFDNLVDNAVQAMRSEGTLTVRLRATTSGLDGLAVDIIDTGEGMDTAVRKRAKDPFFTTRPAGTGLGLAIVDRIVDAHGGEFLIESRAGEGTKVTVLLPYGSPSDLPPPRRSSLSSGEKEGAA